MKEIKGNTYREILTWPTTYRARLFREIGPTNRITSPTFPPGLRSSWPGFSARIVEEWPGHISHLAASYIRPDARRYRARILAVPGLFTLEYLSA